MWKWWDFGGWQKNTKTKVTAKSEGEVWSRWAILRSKPVAEGFLTRVLEFKKIIPKLLLWKK